MNTQKERKNLRYLFLSGNKRKQDLPLKSAKRNANTFPPKNSSATMTLPLPTVRSIRPGMSSFAYPASRMNFSTLPYWPGNSKTSSFMKDFSRCLTSSPVIGLALLWPRHINSPSSEGISHRNYSSLLSIFVIPRHCWLSGYLTPNPPYFNYTVPFHRQQNKKPLKETAIKKPLASGQFSISPKKGARQSRGLPSLTVKKIFLFKTGSRRCSRRR